MISHEIGLKFTFLENRVLLNLAMFHNTYKDIQLTVTRITPGGASMRLLS